MRNDAVSARGYVVGFGLDVVELDEFSRLLIEPAADYLKRTFTQGELDYAGHSLLRRERLAGRFAVKEAVMKAIGVGLGDGIAFTDIEVVTHTSGAPTVALHRSLKSIADERGISGWLVTISHTSKTAVAGAIALCSA